jgi:uncharacterized membrane protein YkvA (DUF1232 family)
MSARSERSEGEEEKNNNNNNKKKKKKKKKKMRKRIKKLNAPFKHTADYYCERAI